MDRISTVEQKKLARLGHVLETLITKSQEELKKSVKKAVNANKGKLITNKKKFGHTDYRKGGMVY